MCPVLVVRCVCDKFCRLPHVSTCQFHYACANATNIEHRLLNMSHSLDKIIVNLLNYYLKYRFFLLCIVVRYWACSLSRQWASCPWPIVIQFFFFFQSKTRRILIPSVRFGLTPSAFQITKCRQYQHRPSLGHHPRRDQSHFHQREHRRFRLPVPRMN